MDGFQQGLSEPLNEAADIIIKSSSNNTVPEEDVSLSSDDSSSSLILGLQTSKHIFTPPPHIAARFCRPSSMQARRKSSAASSRRNSISSTHSRSSHGYPRASSVSVSTSATASGSGAAPQSKHVAQHMRRASILADRKARLADRALHAEQVRMRAALAKAAVRDISISEERAQAAAQAREKNLAEIAASCAEEVKRAKAISESMKEKREQDLLRLRQQIQDRLDEAERRREELRRSNAGRSRSRGQSMIQSGRKSVDVSSSQNPASSSFSSGGAAAESTPLIAMTPEEAAFRILQWWRTQSRRRAICEFRKLNLSVDGVRDTPFDAVVELLEQESVLLTTGKVLRLCGIQEAISSSVKEIVTVRAFLSAYLILGHPTQVLNSNKDVGNGPIGLADSLPTQEDQLMGGGNSAADASYRQRIEEHQEELVAKARDLLIGFETILSRFSHANNYTPPSALASSLAEAYDTFYNAFIAWKARDASALVDVMILQFVELDSIWQTVKDSTDTSVTETYRQSIQQNQILLMVRIKKLAGADEGKKRVFEAVRAARKAKEEVRKKAAAISTNIKPREYENESSTVAAAAATAAIPSASHTTTTPGHGMVPDALLHPDSTGSTAEGGGGVGSGPFTDIYAQHAKLQELAQPSFRRYTNDPLPENRVIVHELSINPKFRISADKYKQEQAEWMAPVFRRMRKTMSASENNIVDREEHFYYLLAVAESLRSKLQRVTVAGKKMHQFVGELLDTEVAQRQIAMGTFSYERFFSSIGQLLPKLCAPIRDEEVQDLISHRLSQGDYVDRLQALYSFVDVMVIDQVNFMISVAAPRLLLSATKYEEMRFAELVREKNLASLPVARAAWTAARGKVLAAAARQDPEGISHPRSRPTPRHFYIQMLVDVFTPLSPPAPMEQRMPEMLWLDYERAMRLGGMTRRIVTVGAILLQCKNLLKRDVRAPWKTEAGRIMSVLEKAEREAVSIEGGIAEEGTFDAQKLYDAIHSNAVVDGVMTVLESGRAMPMSAKANLRSYVQRTIAASADAVLPADEEGGEATTTTFQEPVLRLLLHRLRSYLLLRLSAMSSTEKLRLSNTIVERLTNLGLAEFVDKVRDMVDELDRVGVVDQETHGSYWEQIMATTVE